MLLRGFVLFCVLCFIQQLYDVLVSLVSKDRCSLLYKLDYSRSIGQQHYSFIALIEK
ncbi:hypothetical protein HBA_0165 [Sodalis endosymbiont of Henestaris halophilus]|nr:hypothetical protein HBA_0165 [Sodalis endosymbiont of Henestaris halophilus]